VLQGLLGAQEEQRGVRGAAAGEVKENDGQQPLFCLLRVLWALPPLLLLMMMMMLML